MADDKNKKKEAPASKTGQDVFWEIVGFFFAAIILVSALTRFTVLDLFVATPSNTSTNDSRAVEGDFEFWQETITDTNEGSFPASGDLFLGANVISKGLIQVRREPGGSVIGLQDRGQAAKIVDGPILAYGSRWWMLDYEEPPSGWVEEEDITTKFFWFYIVNFFPMLWGYLKIIGWSVSIFFIITILYISIKETSVPLYDEEPENFDDQKPGPLKDLTKTQTPPIDLPINLPVSPPEQEENTQWRHIELLLKSHNTSDWRQAIIEADVMLEEMLDKMGYPGVSIGDKLKNVEENDFNTLDKAWEAHKVRNRIAHDGIGYKMPYDEVTRVIGLYKDVFKEFYWI